MGGFHVCPAAVLILVLCQGFLFGLTRSQAVNPVVNNPLFRLEWGYLPPHDVYYTPQEKPSGEEFHSEKQNPDSLKLKTETAETHSDRSPEDVAASADTPDSVRKSWVESDHAQGLAAPGKLKEGGYYEDKYQPVAERPLDTYYEDGYQPVEKRPLDTVGSGFMKKDLDEADMEVRKRELDHVGIGLMKRPLDHLGHGLFKKDFPSSLGRKEYVNSAAVEDFLGHGVYSKSADLSENKASAVELIKKGLDVVGTGLFRRGDDHTPGLAEMRRGLQLLSKGLGSGEPSKEVDVDLVKRGLDHVGAGLLKRGLDTEGIGLIKRGVDNIDSALAGRTSLQTMDTEGLGLLNKGLDHLATVLEKDDLEVDGFPMIIKGALSLASWVIQQALDMQKYHHTFSDRKPEPAKKDDESVLFEPAKKSLDELGTGLIKKSLDELGTGLIKKSLDELGTGLIKKSLDELGTGLIKKNADKPSWDSKKHFDDDGSELNQNVDDLSSDLLTEDFMDPEHKLSFMRKLDSLNYKLKNGFINKKQYFELKNSLDKDKRNVNVAKTNSKDVKTEAEEKGYDVYMPMKKSAQDEDGAGFMKKDLDYVGSGLIKKDLGEPEWKELEDSELMLKEKLGWIQPPGGKSAPGTQHQWSKKPHGVDKHPKTPQQKYAEKTKDSLENKYDDKLALKPF